MTVMVGLRERWNAPVAAIGMIEDSFLNFDEEETPIEKDSLAEEKTAVVGERKMTVNEALAYVESLKRTREIEQEYAKKAAVSPVLSDKDLCGTEAAFDLSETMTRLEDLDYEVADIHHKIAEFDVTHIVPGFNQTVDALKELMKAWEKRIEWLTNLLSTPSCYVAGESATGVVMRTNFDCDEAWRELRELEEWLIKARVAIDKLYANETIIIH